MCTGRADRTMGSSEEKQGLGGVKRSWQPRPRCSVISPKTTVTCEKSFLVTIRKSVKCQAFISLCHSCCIKLGPHQLTTNTETPGMNCSNVRIRINISYNPDPQTMLRALSGESGQLLLFSFTVTVGPLFCTDTYMGQRSLFSCDGKCMKPYYGLLLYQCNNESNIILSVDHDVFLSSVFNFYAVSLRLHSNGALSKLLSLVYDIKIHGNHSYLYNLWLANVVLSSGTSV